MKDKFLNGFIAGIIGATVMSILNYIGYSFHTVKDRFYDFSAVLLWGRTPTTLAETVTASFSQILFAAVLGILFAFLTPYLNKRYYLFKGWFYGITSWFFIYSLTTLLKLPAVGQHTLSGTLTNQFSSSAYGIILAFSLKWLDNKGEITNDNFVSSITKVRTVLIPAKKLIKNRKTRDVNPFKIK